MRSDIKTEFLNKENAAEVYEIEKSSFRSPWSFKTIENDLKNPKAFYIGARIRELLVGFIGVWHIINEGHINNFAVLPEWRRQGIGKILMSAVLKEAQKNEMIGLTLEVRVGNYAALKIYESFGFVQEGVRKNYYENKEDAAVMWLRLSPNS